MPLTKSKSQEAFKSNLKAEMAAGKPQKRALAIAFRVQREAKKAGGGSVSPPFYARSEARSLERSGMIHSPVPGRTDRLPMSVRSGAYVIPADVVSGLGQGNSMAGAHGLSQMLKMGPYGSPRGGMRGTRPPKMRGFADGGDVGGDPVDIVAAGGEFVVPPEHVAKIGGGDISKGHETLDAFVKHVRSKTIKTLKKLPGPKKN